jgi:hypothetical protein
MKYKVETSIGCTANCVTVNDVLYSGEDPRYCLTDKQREEFHADLLAEIKRMFEDGERTIFDLVAFLHEESYEVSESCDTCGDSVTTVKYEF